MALEMKEILHLMKLSATADRTSPVAYAFGDEKFTHEQVDEALRNELNELAGTYAAYRRNKDTIFELIEMTIDDVLPRKVLEQYGMFADVMTVAQGDKPIFRQRITEASRKRAKANFVTKVGLAGIYEVFKLDGTSVTIETMAYGGAAQIGLEEFLDGRITFADVLDIVMEGLDEAIYKEIAKALVASITNLPAANKVTTTSFHEKSMDRLVAIADSYGKATIYCTYEFAATILPANSSGTSMISDTMRDTLWSTGFIANYKGHSVIVLPQSYEDDNDTKVIDPSYAWVIPVGASKPVKIAFEGQTITQEFENKDGSRDIHVYKKIGVATLITDNICSYRNTALYTDWHFNPSDGVAS